jgi:hypothetical protein
MKTPKTWFKDLSLISNLLAGINLVDPKVGDGRWRYLTPKEEREGRKALADLLRSCKRPPDLMVEDAIEQRKALFNETCHLLADMIDPHHHGRRKIVFKNGKGQLPQYIVDLDIISSVRLRARPDGPLTVEEAVAEAVDKHNVSESRVWKLWSDREIIWRKYLAFQRNTSP